VADPRNLCSVCKPKKRTKEVIRKQRWPGRKGTKLNRQIKRGVANKRGRHKKKKRVKSGKTGCGSLAYQNWQPGKQGALVQKPAWGRGAWKRNRDEKKKAGTQNPGISM